MIEFSFRFGSFALEWSMHPAVPIGLAFIISMNVGWLAWLHVREKGSG